MISTKLIPAAFLAVAATVSGLTVATAQTSDIPMTRTQGDLDPTKADFRFGWGGDRDGRGDRQWGQGGRRHGGGEMFGQMMQDVDANADGAITQEEINAFYTAKVAEADASGDGDLSLEEFQTIFAEMTRGRMVDVFQRLDDDGDGAVTAAELDDRFGNVVERMDRNDDGQLDADDRGRRGRRN